MVAFLFLCYMIPDDKAEYLKEKEQMLLQNLRCEELAKQFKAGHLDLLKPIWHTDKPNIDLAKQPDQITNDIMSNGYTIMLNVNLSKLLQTFIPGKAKAILKRKIIASYGFENRKFCRILEHWQNSEPLIPPIIVFHNYYQLNYPQDGKHRLKIAHHLGVTDLPIIVPNLHYSAISALLV